MRLVHLTKVRSGMVVARAIYGSSGQKLLNAVTVIKTHYIKYLQQLGIGQIYVKDERLEGVNEEDIIAERTRLEVRALIKEMMQESRGRTSARKFCIIEDKISEGINILIEELLDNENLIISLADIRSADSYTFDHSLTVTLLSLILAMKLNYPLSLIKRNTIGFLLHDLGYVKVPERILRKQGPLTREEYALIKKHPQYGYELFKKSSLYSDSAAKIIYQHHERLEGQGYPRGLKKENIHWLAQIAAIADTYDALTSQRPYRKYYRPDEALNILSVEGGTKYNHDMLTAFFSFIAAYPTGTHVKLSTGESGLVIANREGYPYRPVVRVLYEGEKHPHPNPYEIDLTQKLDVVVRGVVNRE